MDRQQDVIRRITAHVIAYRFALENERHESRKKMAIEIKGLKADALTARANLDKLRAAYAKFNEAAPAHAADVEGLAESIGGMQSDLEFAATVMGNSDGASGVSQKPPVVRQNVQAGSGDSNVPKALPEGTAATTETTDRVALGPHPDQPEVGQRATRNESDIPKTVPLPVVSANSPEAMPDTTEGAIWIKTPASGGGAAKAYDEVVKFTEVEQKAAATFRAAE